MGHESFNASMRALVSRAAKLDYQGEEDRGRKPRLLDKTIHLHSNSRSTNPIQNTSQPSSLVVFESNPRLRAWYDHLEGRYFDTVVAYQDREKLVHTKKHRLTARCVILEIGKNSTTDTHLVAPILKSYPNADLVLTIAKGSSPFFSDIVEYSQRVTLLERPFTMSSLVALVRQLTTQFKVKT